MKRTTIKLLMLSCIVSAQFGCSKKSDMERLGIDDTKLTICPSNTNCEYLFSENVDIQGESPTIKPGSFRLFWVGLISQGMDSRLYIKAPMKGNSFYLDESALESGSVLLYRSCATCLMSPIIPIKKGYVKGLNLTPGKPADQSKWLIQARVVLENASIGSSFKDTVFIKQQFYPNFVYN